MVTTYTNCARSVLLAQNSVFFHLCGIQQTQQRPCVLKIVWKASWNAASHGHDSLNVQENTVVFLWLQTLHPTQVYAGEQPSPAIGIPQQLLWGELAHTRLCQGLSTKQANQCQKQGRLLHGLLCHAADILQLSRCWSTQLQSSQPLWSFYIGKSRLEKYQNRP